MWFKRNHQVSISVLGLTLFAVAAIGQPVQAATVVVGEQETVVTSPASFQTSIEFFLDLTEGDDGGTLSVGNFMVRVGLTGPNAGTDVSIVGIDDTVSIEHPQTFPLDVKSVVNTTEGFGAVINLSSPFDIDDLDGLVRIILEVQPNVIGDYTLELIPGDGNTILTDPNDFVTLLPINLENGSLSIVPVPVPAGAWTGLALLGGLGVARRVRQNKLRQQSM